MYREIKRSRFVDDALLNLNGYYGLNAHRSAVERRKLVRFVNLRVHVFKQFERVHRYRSRGACGMMVKLCASLMMRSKPMFTGPTARLKNWPVICHIVLRRRHPRARCTPRGIAFSPDRSIHVRPAYVRSRETFGEWEGDLKIFERAQGKMKVASLFDRKTRLAVPFRNNYRSTTHLMIRLMGALEPLPNLHANQSRSIAG